MRVRARLTKGVKVNHKRSHLKDLSCSFCKRPMEESQEHLEEECPGREFERMKLPMKNWRGQLTFWRRMTARIDNNKKKGKGVAGGRVNKEGRVVEKLV